MKITDRFRKMCVNNPWLQKTWKEEHGDWFYHPKQDILIRIDDDRNVGHKKDYFVEVDEGISIYHLSECECRGCDYRVDEIAAEMYWIPNLNDLMNLAKEELGLGGYALRRDINLIYWTEMQRILDPRRVSNVERYWTELADDEIVLAYWMKKKYSLTYNFESETWWT